LILIYLQWKGEGWCLAVSLLSRDNVGRLSVKLTLTKHPNLIKRIILSKGKRAQTAQIAYHRRYQMR